jgi:ubiquinone/menaquinone biosynthesis C-methylase UbiE
MARLIHLDQFTTQAMGGPLAEQSPAFGEQLRLGLDLGCGPGGWVLDMAYAYPKAEIAGVDVSHTMTAYANARAQSQGLNNASFEVMDLTRPLEFSDASFDLVNARFLVAALPAAQWPSLLAECRRVLRPGGLLRVTEPVDAGTTNSLAFERIQQLVCGMMQQRGYGFSPDGHGFGIVSVLPHLLRRAGYREVSYQAHTLEISKAAPVGPAIYDSTRIVYLLSQPNLVGAGLISQPEVDQLYEQMLADMQQEDFCGMWHFTTCWATNPG